MEYRLIPIEKKRDIEFRERLKENPNYPTPEILIQEVNDKVFSDNWNDFPVEVKDLLATYRNVKWNDKDKLLQVLSLEEMDLTLLKTLLPQVLLVSTLKRVAETIILMFPINTYICGTRGNPNYIHIYNKELNGGEPSVLAGEASIARFFTQVANNIFLAQHVEDLGEDGDSFIIQPDRILGMYVPLLSILVEMIEVELLEDAKKRKEYWKNKRAKYYNYIKGLKSAPQKRIDELREMVILNNEKYEKWKREQETEELLIGEHRGQNEN